MRLLVTNDAALVSTSETAVTGGGPAGLAGRLAEIIRDVHAGRHYVDSDIAASALTEDTRPLTARELDVLRTARTGAAVTEIAAAVHLAPGTVRNYLSSTMTKLGVSTRHAAAHTAWEQGWI